jgi:hypothetical protein
MRRDQFVQRILDQAIGCVGSCIKRLNQDLFEPASLLFGFPRLNHAVDQEVKMLCCAEQKMPDASALSHSIASLA